MHTVSASVDVTCAPEEAWTDLTDGSRLSRWFADSEDLRPHAPFRFDFGDGDFFVGQVKGFDESCRLELEWRFMGVGPVFDIRIELSPSHRGTEVRVWDHGSRTEAEAETLREGWTDFLSRLAQYVRSGERARYDWSPTIGTAALAAGPPAEVLAVLREPGWWSAQFGGNPSLGPTEARRQKVEFRESAWGRVTTNALVTVEEDPQGSYVAVTHAGWTELPPNIRIDERRRFAGLWARALARLESRNGR